MKNSIYPFIASLLTQMSMAQSPDNVLEVPSLWLKGKSATEYSAKNTDTAHFNFNPIAVQGAGKEFVYKNALSEKYSLFAVFQSDSEEEISLINLKMNGRTTTITNKKISRESVFQKANPNQGMVLTYLASRELKGRKKSSIIVQNYPTSQNGEGSRNTIIELLCYPGLVNDLQRRKIESYLSIKHGISLLGVVDYINSEEQKIWDSKENMSYSKRVTGIGRDDQTGLYQKQSGNSQKDGLYIALGEFHASNSMNTNEIPNATFLLWADNDGSVAMKTDKKVAPNVKTMKRVWKMQSTNDVPSLPLRTQVVIDKNKFSIDDEKIKEANIEEDDFVWLAIDRNGSSVFDYANAEYFMQSRDEEGKLFFDNVAWDSDKSGSDTFTFVKGPDFFVLHSLSETDCLQEKGTATLALVGGQAPFTVLLDDTSSTHSAIIQERYFEISVFDGNKIFYDITDSRQRRQKDTLYLQNPNKIVAALDEQWYLDANTKQVIVVPKIEISQEQQLIFSWRTGETELSKDPNFTATEVGDYLLVVSNAMGCKHELYFRVNDVLDISTPSWSLYPNPVQPDEDFHLKFTLEKEAEVTVGIFDFSNKLIKEKKLGKLQHYVYKENLSTIGTFLIVVTIDEKATSAKIIIK